MTAPTATHKADPAPAEPDTVVQRVITTTGDTARDVARRTATAVEGNPLSVLVGGVALGLLAGAFVPRGERETRLLAPLGKRLTDTARGAVKAATETAKSEFDILGLSRNAAKDQAGKLLGGIVGAITAASAAALTTARDKPAQPAEPKAD